MTRTLSITLTYTADKERSVAQLLEALAIVAEVDYQVEPQTIEKYQGFNAEQGVQD